MTSPLSVICFTLDEYVYVLCFDTKVLNKKENSSCISVIDLTPSSCLSSFLHFSFSSFSCHLNGIFLSITVSLTQFLVGHPLCAKSLKVGLQYFVLLTLCPPLMTSSFCHATPPALLPFPPAGIVYFYSILSVEED